MRTRPNSWLEDPRRPGKFDWTRYFGFVLALAYLVPVTAVIAGWPRFWGGYILGPGEFSTTVGVISVSEVTEEQSRFSHSFHYRIEYQYEVDGRRLHSSRVTFGLEGFNSRETAETYSARYPLGATVLVHYYRGDPEYSVLEPETRDETLLVYWALVLTMPAIVIGLAVVAWVQSRKRMRRGLNRRFGVP